MANRNSKYYAVVREKDDDQIHSGYQSVTPKLYQAKGVAQRIANKLNKRLIFNQYSSIEQALDTQLENSFYKQYYANKPEAKARAIAGIVNNWDIQKAKGSFVVVEIKLEIVK